VDDAVEKYADVGVTIDGALPTENALPTLGVFSIGNTGMGVVCTMGLVGGLPETTESMLADRGCGCCGSGGFVRPVRPRIDEGVAAEGDWGIPNNAGPSPEPILEGDVAGPGLGLRLRKLPIGLANPLPLLPTPTNMFSKKLEAGETTATSETASGSPPG
jgi:hypothetical protein